MNFKAELLVLGLNSSLGGPAHQLLVILAPDVESPGWCRKLDLKSLLPRLNYTAALLLRRPRFLGQHLRHHHRFEKLRAIHLKG